MSEQTVSAGLARGLAELAVSKGADRAALLAQAGIDPDALEDNDNRVPLARYVALTRAGKELSGDCALALHYGEMVDLSEISVVGLITLASETMAEAFRQINRYRGLVIEVDGVGSGDRFIIESDADGPWLVDTRANPNDFPELTEATFARMACGPRRFSDTLRVRAVHVTHPAPRHRAEYERIFDAPVVFDSDRNAMLLTGNWFMHRVAVQPRFVFGILSDHAEALLRQMESSRTTSGRVESLLMPILHTGTANIGRIAALMGLSRQTLYRRLKAEGTSFEKTLDALRYKLALHYLGGNKVSVNEIAYLVGFSDPAAFSRAFKRWTGSSPREARRLKP